MSITIYATEEPQDWRQHVAQAFDAVKRVEDLTTSFSDSSDIGQVNVNAGRNYYPVDDEVLEIVRQAQEISKLSHGAFDITILPLLRLWRFKSAHPRVPNQAEISAKRALVGYNKIDIKGNEIQLPERGMGLDLGGIAKGYAVDRAAELLRAFGYEDFLIDAGGDLRAFAGPLTRGRRTIWVRHPRTREGFFAKIKMDSGAVATSGDYERYFEIDGKRYHHVLDPATGSPGRPAVSVTIFAPTTARADAVATAVFVLGPQQGMAFIEKDSDLEGLIIFEKDSNLQWTVSQGIANKLNILEP
ncbi:MAG: FAD:protein FMN transferase [bacterium]